MGTVNVCPDDKVRLALFELQAEKRICSAFILFYFLVTLFMMTFSVLTFPKKKSDQICLFFHFIISLH